MNEGASGGRSLYFLPEADEDEKFAVTEFEAASLRRVIEKIKEKISGSDD